MHVPEEDVSLTEIADHSEIDGATVRRLWLTEIIREMEHYYQAETQNDQRASWLLATSSLLLTLTAGIAGSLGQARAASTRAILVVTVFTFMLSIVLALSTAMPLNGTRPWRDVFGRTYRRYKKMPIHRLIEERFRPDVRWSETAYELHVFYHFRSHYLRYMRKARGVWLSSACFFVGLLSLILVLVTALAASDLGQLLDGIVGIIQGVLTGKPTR